MTNARNVKRTSKAYVSQHGPRQPKLSKYHLIAFAIIIGAIGSYLLYRSFALTTTLPPVAGKNTSYNLGVLVLKYFPLTADGKNIDINVTGDVGDSYQTVRQNTTTITNDFLSVLPKATTYLGNTYSGNTPSLTYHIVDTHEYTEAVPIKARTGRPTYADYNSMMTKENICNYVDNQGVHEIWLWAYSGPNMPGTSHPYLDIDASKMAGPYGDISNSGEYNDMPVCKHTYVVYTFNYHDVHTSNLMLSWGRQVGRELLQVDNHLWTDLYQGTAYPQAQNVNGRCGSVDNPPNARYQFDYANPTSQNSDCDDWNPDGMGSLAAVSCADWGCQDVSETNNAMLNYIVWNLQHIPGMNNTTAYQWRTLRNWWDIYGNFDAVMGSGAAKSLIYTNPMAYQPNTASNELNGDVDAYLTGQGTTGDVWSAASDTATTKWTGWNKLGHPGNGGTARMTTAVMQNGSQAVFMHDTSGNLWLNTSPLPGSNTWSGWTSLGHPNTTTLSTYYPYALATGDGRLDVIDVGADHVLYHNWETSPNGSWNGWVSLGTPSGVSLQSIAVTNDADGAEEVFVTGTDGNLWNMRECMSQCSWGAWANLGNPGTNLGAIAAARNQNGRLEVFANGSDGKLYHTYETSDPPSWTWSAWTLLAPQSGFTFNKFTSNGQGPLVAADQDGHLDLVELATNGSLMHIYQTSPNGTWSAWSNYGLPSGITPASMSVVNNPAGEVVLMITGSDGNLWYNPQNAPNGAWAGWAKITPGAALAGDCNGDGHVTVTDLSTLLGHFNQSYTPCDFNGDGTDNTPDLSILLSNYGK